MREFFRKRIVSLKRSPQMIPMLFVIIACFIFTFSLSIHSSAALGGMSDADKGVEVAAHLRSPGLYMFVITLFSIMSVISYLTTYKKGKLSVLMLVVTFVMLALVIVCDILYVKSVEYYAIQFHIDAGHNIPLEELQLDADELAAKVNITWHIVFTSISIALIALVPVIRKLLGLIDTSVDDEYDRLMEQKSDEELVIEIDEKA